ncbi:MAG: archaellin/type IV pilin N-terminal domain-containing protein [Nanoarchaeota archaeon]
MNLKKAVSPLIATIVLISFTIAIGSLVINWGKQFITAQTQGLQQTGVQCQKENIQVVSVKLVNISSDIGNKPYSNFSVIIKNIGDTDFNLGPINIYTQNGNVYTNNTISLTIGKGDAKQFYVIFKDYNATKDSANYLEIASKDCPQNLYYNYNIQQ